MADKKKALLLRISPELWESLNRWAKDELRSLNAQIEYVLRDAVRRHERRRGEEKGTGVVSTETDGERGR